MMLRMLRPDLLCALAGFALGAMALIVQASIATTAPSPPVHHDILAQLASPTPGRPAG